jgi:Ca2+/Na+ antiporter
VIDIARSLGITFAVSGAISYFLTNFNINFWSGFMFITVLQFIGWSVFSYYSKVKLESAAIKFEESLVSEVSKNEVVLACTFCNHPNLVPISVSRDNRFICEQCNKENSVYIEIEAVARTEPVDTTEGIKVNNFNG